jgi:hypothetical protein
MLFPPPTNKLETHHRDYRYKLSGTPRQRDNEVIKVIMKAIFELRKKQTVFAAANIWPHTLDDKLHGPNSGRGARKLYAFTQTLEEFPLATEVKMTNFDSDLTSANIRIRQCKQNDTQEQPWSSLQRWLVELPIPERLTSGTTKIGVPCIVFCQQL